ncbi:hypothetical protein [Ferrimonas sp.]|uniref:hypothetical protein n=1 Tax=Ferrimonas sp. TaxID=2080861 RepID=UPI003A941D19
MAYTGKGKPGLGFRLPQSFTRDKTIVAVLKGKVELLTLSEPSLSPGRASKL